MNLRLLLLVPTVCLVVLAASAVTYENPLLPGDLADPSVLRHDGVYYLYATGEVDGDNGTRVYTSTNLVDWTSGPVVFRPGRRHVWAPDVWRDPGSGRFYLYYTVSQTVGVAEADGPLGPFVERRKFFDQAIDAHLFRDDDGRLYLYYVQLPGFRITVQPMASPTEPLGEGREVLRPEAPWETRAGRVTEGPWMIKRNGRYHLLYSGSGADTPDYGVGYATADHPTGPFTRAAHNPIVHRSEGVYGPGHGCAVQDGAGEWWHVYHQKRRDRVEWGRFIALDPLRFDAEGLLHGSATRGVRQPRPVTFADAATSPRGVEFHVAIAGDDAHPGTAAAPFRTIQRAAERAQPGDVITVHAGIYRERINPPRGGESDARRITYRAAPGEKVEIRGSEVVKGWEREREDTWKVVLPEGFFGAFNPYSDLIRGDWFDPRGRPHHTGAVYLDGEWLTEAARLEDVLQPAGATPVWFGRVEGGSTTLWAQFKGVDPNARLVEINVRRTVFYPDQPGRHFLTVRGFAMRHAATPWAPPTAEQVGLVGTHWSRGWIIESNVVSHSVCSGIALGKHGDAFDNTSADTAEGYVKTIERAYARGWTREAIGHHLVRGNTISHCEQAGIVGSLGAAFSTISGNHIHDIHVRRIFSGAEMAGIKIHAAIDCVIRGNRIHRTVRGLWLDWMAQGTRVSGNLFHGNLAEDLFVEVNHGPFVVDNNLFLSPVSLLDMSEGGAYAHNLFLGRIHSRPELSRATPFHPAHSTATAGLTNIQGGDNRFFNNVLVGPGVPGPGATVSEYGLRSYDARPLPLMTGGNLYLHGARPYGKEEDAVVLPPATPPVRIEESGDGLGLWIDLGPGRAGTGWVTTERLGKARIPGVGYEHANGSPLRIDTDYFGERRSGTQPTVGPFEGLGSGPARLKVW